MNYEGVKPKSTAGAIARDGNVVGNSNFYSLDDLDEPGNLSNLSQNMALGATSLAARESVIRLHMEMKEDQYTELQSFRIFIGTWNVNGHPPTVSLGEYWLACDPNPPDIYAIGFQELDLSKEAFLFNDTPREEEWFRACNFGLHPKASYFKLKLVRLIGMMLVVFVREELKEYIRNVMAETVGTGILGKMGNKGGVAVRFDFHNSSLCFVNSHLAAHVEEYERRNQDYNEICSRMLFNQFNPPKSIKDHDHIYWFGDLNYRLMDLTTDGVKQLLEKKEFPALIKHDQLKIQHNLKNVFDGYIEGEIRHLPTYKYDPGTNEWDSSEKNRPPAWCDRVLWRGGPTKQLIYRSHMKMMISDHKPVSALFDAKIKVTDTIKYRKIYEEVMKKLDKLENEFLPQVSVDKMEINFESFTFREIMTDTLTIANTGQVPVRFEFIKKPNDNSFCKSWLKIKPFTAMVKPGNKLDIELEAFVDIDTAFKFNTGQEKIYDILVLHLDGGKDLFITVNGNYIPSSFGSSIDTLVRLKCPMREVNTQSLFLMEQKKYNDMQIPCWDIPKELWLLIDPLYKYGMLHEDLFQQRGLISDVCKIRDTLDKGWPEKLSGNNHSIAEALLLFLEALAIPVIPYDFYHRSLECSSNFISCKQVINDIPESHRHVFYYLIAFLRELLRHSNSNKLDAKILASVFGSILLREDANSFTDKGLQAQVTRKKSAFVYHFLVNQFDI